jgi:hypothetical protein
MNMQPAGPGRAYALKLVRPRRPGRRRLRQSARRLHDFFTLWKDADPGLPILIAAKSEYAKLQ